MNSEIKTAKGTKLPLINLKGKEYLQVAHRLVWFREEHPEWSIQTEFIEINTEKKYAICKATITDPAGYFEKNIDPETNEIGAQFFKGVIIATAHKTETSQGFADYLEKAETGAIGRALAMCGYGTQFAPEIEEGERLVDSPQASAPSAPARKTPSKYTPPTQPFENWNNGEEGDVEVLITDRQEKTAASGTRYAILKADNGMILKAFKDLVDDIHLNHSYALTVQANEYNGVMTYNIQRLNTEL